MVAMSFNRCIKGGMGVGAESRGGSLYTIIVTIFLEHRLNAITPVISGRVYHCLV